jgi:hypothetical protein
VRAVDGVGGRISRKKSENRRRQDSCTAHQANLQLVCNATPNDADKTITSCSFLRACWFSFAKRRVVQAARAPHEVHAVVNAFLTRFFTNSSTITSSAIRRRESHFASASA